MRKIYILATSLFIMTAGCNKMEDFQTDPNKPGSVTPELLLNTIEQSAFQVVDQGIALTTRQVVYLNSVSQQQYYNWNRGSFDTYNKILQVQKMEAEAVRTERPQYQPIARFFKAWYFLSLTNTFGDVPYKEALKGESDTIVMAYDKQEDIYIDILNELEAANKLITTSTKSVEGDIIYGGDMSKWKKLINTLELRVLMSLSLKEKNTSLNIKARFAAIVNDPVNNPILTSSADNGQLVFHDLIKNRYRYYNDNDMTTAYYMEEGYVNLMKSKEDPRLFSIAEKARLHKDDPDSTFSSYGGAKGSAPLNENAARAVSGEISRINPRYYSDPVNEPSVALGYPELQFILAEAAVRGWISGDAATYYNNGVTASMQFYKVNQGSIDTYLQKNPYVASAGLETIMTQKYLASFLNGGWQIYYDQRRTGFPVFDVSGDGVLNDKKVPKRWMYPENEMQTNQANISAAISRQYPEGDNINGVMWSLKAE